MQFYLYNSIFSQFHICLHALYILSQLYYPSLSFYTSLSVFPFFFPPILLHLYTIFVLPVSILSICPKSSHHFIFHSHNQTISVPFLILASSFLIRSTFHIPHTKSTKSIFTANSLCHSVILNLRCTSHLQPQTLLYSHSLTQLPVISPPAITRSDVSVPIPSSPLNIFPRYFQFRAFQPLTIHLNIIAYIVLPFTFIILFLNTLPDYLIISCRSSTVPTMSSVIYIEQQPHFPLTSILFLSYSSAHISCQILPHSFIHEDIKAPEGHNTPQTHPNLNPKPFPHSSICPDTCPTLSL